MAQPSCEPSCLGRQSITETAPSAGTTAREREEARRRREREEKKKPYIRTASFTASDAKA